MSMENRIASESNKKFLSGLMGKITPDNQLHHPLGESVTAASNRTIGKLLVQSGRLRFEDAEQIAAAQKTSGVRFGEMGVTLGLLTDAEVRVALSDQYGYNYLEPGQGNFSQELVAAYQPFTPQAEVMRKLRTELLLRWFNADRKALALVSPAQGDGRSYLAANLAVAFAQLGESTLLIDADMRNPRLHKIFNCDDSIGLSGILGGRANSYLDGISRVSELPNLSILSAGAIPPNPLELLGKIDFQLLLAFLSESYGIVLIDSPCTASHTDARVVAARAGGALIIARKNVTRAADLKGLTDAFTASGTSIVGTVMNNR